MEIDEEVLNNWINGNFSVLDRHDLIQIARYFEDKVRTYEEKVGKVL